MKICQVHNSYLNPTGDDSVVEEEKHLLQGQGHEVIQFIKKNQILANASWLEKARLGLSLKGSAVVAREFDSFLYQEKPDLVHAHNIFPLITPEVFKVCKAHNIPVVQTLHNYRLVCVNTLLYRDGHLCQDCLKYSLQASVKHSCYNGSKVQSFLMANALKHHRAKNTWNSYIDRFICLSEFARAKFIQGGIESERLVVKPNFVKKPKTKITYEGHWLYAGKLEEQKGLMDFIDLVKSLPSTIFKVAGYCVDSSLFEEYPNVDYLGILSRRELLLHMTSCKGVLFLSKMYEGMPMTILEAFAHRKAVIARNQGAMREMIDHGRNGILYDDQKELIQAVVDLENENRYKSMGAEAYRSYSTHYNEEKAYLNIRSIYDDVLN